MVDAGFLDKLKDIGKKLEKTVEETIEKVNKQDDEHEGPVRPQRKDDISISADTELGPCSLVTEDEVSSVFGTPFSQPQRPHLVRSNEILISGDCYYRSDRDLSTQVTVHINSYPGQSKKHMLSMTRKRMPGGKTISGIGEDAYVTATGGGLASIDFCQGDTLVSIMVTAPGNIDRKGIAIALAEIAAERLDYLNAQKEKAPIDNQSLVNTQSGSESSDTNEPEVEMSTDQVKLSELNLSSSPGIILIDTKLAAKAKKKQRNGKTTLCW